MVVATLLSARGYDVYDVDSRYDYTKIFDLNNTQYDGRIWTDKSVFAEDITYTGNVHEIGEDEITNASGKVTVTKGEGEDFLVSYSALASTTTVISETESPIDLVLVLDMSPMSNSQAGKLASMLHAVESAVEAIMGLNENNRVAIVAYSSQAEVLLPLGHYTSVEMDSGNGVASQATTVTCTYDQNGKTESSTFDVSYQNGTPVNKYTQMGVYTGMNVLLDVENDDLSITVGEGGTEVQRQPALILMSEGEPKIASTKIDNPTKSTVQADGTIDTNGEEGLSTEYDNSVEFRDRVEIKRNEGLADINSNSGGDNNGKRHAQTFATILTAAHMKNLVSEHYNLEDEGKMQVYTIGINTATANAPELAKVVLDPRAQLGENTNFKEYVESYFDNESVDLPNAGKDDARTKFSYDEKLELHEEDLKYNDGYFDVVGTGSDINWEGVFDLVLSQVTANTAKVPTLVDKTDTFGNESGFLNYEDPLGEYMELKEVKAMIINDVIYRVEKIKQDDDRYIVDGTATNPVYGTHDLSEIEIFVKTNDDGMQTLCVKIPAALIPLRQTTVTMDVNEEIIGFSHNSAYPFRLVYSVGLKDNVLNEDGTVNMDTVSSEYIEKHTVNGQVQFYEGLFTSGDEPGAVGYEGKTVGDAFVSYTPALDNPFYYVDEPAQLYTDKACEHPATKFQEGVTYYFQDTYYEAVTDEASPVKAMEKTVTIERPPGTIPEESTEVTDGKLHLKEGSPRLGNLAEFRREKISENRTETADIYLYLSYEGSHDDDENIHDFKIFHGNNGRLSAQLPDGTLSVTKQVINGEDAEIKDFTFQITLKLPNGADPPDISGLSWTKDENEENKYFAEFTLRADETKTFKLPPDTRWEVTETTNFDEHGDHWPSHTVTVDGEEDVHPKVNGTMAADGSTAATFTSTHTIHTGTLTVQKKVEGYVGDQSFTFEVKYQENKESKTETIYLKNNQSKSFTVDTGATWTVTETDPGEHWTTEISGAETIDSEKRQASDTITEDGVTQTVAFTNTYTAPGSLLVSKKAVGVSDPNAEYTFKVTINDQEEQLTLKAGEEKLYDNLAAGTTWKVEESSTLGEGWSTTVNGQAGTVANGTIVSGETATAAFVNTAPGKLIVTKKVTGDGAPQDREFDFTLTHGNETTDFTLKDGDQKEFTFPAGTTWKVEESSTLGEGWSTTVNGQAGTVANGTIAAGAEVTVPFVNAYQKPADPDPGETIDYTLHYESNGGTAYENEQYEKDTLVALDKAPTREGYTFTGWYADESLTELITEVRMTSDKTVYAGWKITGVPDWLNGSDHFAYVIGYTDGTVRPLNNISRAEVATIFFRLLDPKVREENLNTVGRFSDVTAGMWCNTAIATLADLGIVNGRAAESFDPDAPITRAEFAAICARFSDMETRNNSDFTDIAGHWAEKEIQRAAALGWIQGYDDGSFRPDKEITRAEAMTMINRVLQRLPESGDDLLPDMNVWPDNQPDAWYYLAVQEATNSHDFDRKDDGVHEQWTKMTTDPDWKQYE